MELSQLRYFVAIAETNSFTEAAQRVHVSQPALSYQIKQLENELGARLFERTSRKVSLTLDGRSFLPLAQGVLSKADEATRVMKERLGVETGEVTLGTIPTIGAFAVPQVLASFRRNFPGVRVNLLEAGVHTLERSVLDREADFAVVSTVSVPDAVEVVPLLVEELFLVVPPWHRLADDENVQIRDLATEEFALLGGSFVLTEQVVEACRQAGFEPQVAYETGSLESIKSLIVNGLGVAVLPKLALQSYDETRLRAIPFREPMTRTINLIRGKDRYMTVAARALMVHVRSTLLSSFPDLARPTGVR